MFNSSCKKFEELLKDLINNSGLTVAEAYYIVENAALELKILYTELSYKERLGEMETTSTITIGDEEKKETEKNE